MLLGVGACLQPGARAAPAAHRPGDLSGCRDCMPCGLAGVGGADRSPPQPPKRTACTGPLLQDILRREWGYENYVEEYVRGALRASYDQQPRDLNGLAGCTALRANAGRCCASLTRVEEDGEGGRGRCSA